MKILFLSILLILLSTIVSAQQYIDDYFMLERKWATTVSPIDGSVTGGWAMTDDRIYWAAPGTTHSINWPSVQNSELFEIRHNCSDTQSYLFLNGYAPHNNPHVPAGRVWWIKSDKVLITVGGVVYDITDVALGTNGCERWENNLNNSGVNYRVGMPFAPYKFWNQPYRIQVWGKTADHLGNFNGNAFYWDALWEPYQSGYNACWVGAGSTTRSTINLTEAYWGENGGWAIGNGQMGANGQPNGLAISYGRTIGYGLDAGPNWTYVDNQNGGQQCIYNLYDW